MEKKSLNLKGKTVAYLEAGNADDVPVLFLHGVPETSLIWKEILPAIAANGFRTIAPDLPGFGNSDCFDEISTWDRYEQFISEFTEMLGLEQLHLVVHDWGGLIGLSWTCENLDRVLSLIISDTTISDEYKWHKLAQIWRTPGAGEQLMKQIADWDAFRTGMQPAVPFADTATLWDFFQVFRTPESSSVVLQLYRSATMAKVTQYKGKLSSFKQPVSIIWGESDSYIPVEFAFKLKKESLPQADIHLIKNAGHFIHLEQPDKVKSLLSQHLDAFK
ncbi:alpha/beta fold hydrolase [Peribacillus sp. SCS-155]|uniref:alpha/beta fold hydrolase n=1 Tax=Peribacillus sedimenti TaxID=3115297 RepID=UPI003906B02B